MAHEIYRAECLAIVGPLGGVTTHALFIAVGPGQKAWLIGVEHATVSGSGVFAVQRKTRDMPTFGHLPGGNAIATTTTEAQTDLGPVGVYDGDRFRVVFDEGGDVDGFDVAFRFRIILHDHEHEAPA
jgi:tryptophan synthase beta subunit